MKKLNNKGFTLVELLAVIVILAIVVGITMVTILPTLSNAKESAFKTAVDTIQVYVQEEYDKCLLGDASLAGDKNITFESGCTAPKTDQYTGILTKTGYTNDIVISAITISGGRVSVSAYPNTNTSSNGKFKDVATYKSSSPYTAS